MESDTVTPQGVRTLRAACAALPAGPGSDGDVQCELPRHDGAPGREDLRPSSHPTTCQEVYFHC